MKRLRVMMMCFLCAFLLVTGCDRQVTMEKPKVKGEKNGVVNHGHSIKEASGPRPDEIRRSDDLVMDQDEALKYLEDSVALPDSDMRFLFAESSDNDPGAYMWYGFYIYKDNICINNRRFDVIAFTDGTVCTGKEDVLSCGAFASPEDEIGPDEALERYKQSPGSADHRDYHYAFNRNYNYQRMTNECILTYMYRYECGIPSENYTLILDAVSGEFMGRFPDEYDD